ncbi:MAG: CDP-diacylglycerol--glycerol-3-phosphate 3-phosphatidyltransferase [Syntrophales bacterium]|nr:CDP-diacylglycerol--glycerol-3-phosphate 3-phosphatidyltransferase [Syntrophales bacterium]
MSHFLKNSFEKMTASKGKSEVFNLPNSITLLRLAVIPVLFLLLLSPGRILSMVIAVLFIIASITDLIDGYVARKYNIVTTMGKFLDPVADKLVVTTAMIMMIPIDRIPAWIVAVIIMRDLLVDGLRSIASAEGLVIDASRLGKQKTLCQIIAVSALLIHYDTVFSLDAHAVGIVVLYLALALTLWSGADYFMKFYKQKIRK